MIDAGATAFLCPIASNHGVAVTREVDFALGNGATLGETMKSTYDDIYLASRGDLRLGIQVIGEAPRHPEYVMQGGGANRILLGDPALQPFRPTPHPLERVEINNGTENGFEVVVTWKPGFHGRAWDMYGEYESDWTVRARVSLDGLVPAGKELAFSAEVRSADDDAQPLPYSMTHAEPEVYHGRRYLHLQANAPRDLVENEYVRAVFQVTFR